MAARPDEDFQPRFVAYALSHGRTPADQLAYDRHQRPTAPMARFMGWMDSRWYEWQVASGWEGPTLSDADHAAFDAWLVDRVDAPARVLLRACPTCGAPIGALCRTLPQPGVPSVPTSPHKARLR